MSKPSFARSMRAVGFLTVSLCISCQSAGAGRNGDGFVSAYGFEMDVSTDWVALTKDTIQEVLAEGEKHLPESANREVLAQVAETIKKGDMEMLMNFEAADARFTDNINILRAYGEIPTSTADVMAGCRMFGQQLSTAYGRKARVHECGAAEVAGRRAMFSKFEGIVPDTSSSQYHVPSGRSRFVTITATYANSRASKLEAEFERIIGSVRFP